MVQADDVSPRSCNSEGGQAEVEDCPGEEVDFREGRNTRRC